MKLRNTIAAGLGLAACLCMAIAATTAQQTEERTPFKIFPVTGNDLSAAGQQPVNESAAGDAAVSQGVQAIPLDGEHRLAVASGPQRVVVSEDADPLRGGVPGGCPASGGGSGICGDTCVTQNNDSELVLINGSTVACSTGAQNQITLENSWARCFPGSAFPNDIVLQCIDIGIESNSSPADNTFDFDLRITRMLPSNSFPVLGCPLPSGNPPLAFGNETLNQTWFEVGPDFARPEFDVLHLQRVRLANDFEGILKITLNKLVLIPEGTNLLVEVHGADRTAGAGGDNGGFRIGGNEANASGSTYIWSTQCNINDYQDVASVDASFTADFVMRLDGSEGDISGICCNNVAGGDCSTAPYGVTTFVDCEALGGRFCPAATVCPAPGTPFCPDFEGSGSPPCPFVVVNDDCGNLIVLSGDACAPLNTVIATDSGALFPAGFGTIHNDVFFGYIVKAVSPLPNTNGRLIVSTFGSDFDTNVAIYRVITGDIRVPAELALICADILLGSGGETDGQFGGFGDDILNRPASAIDPLTYICVVDQAPGVIVPGDQFVIRVGSPFANVGGSGFLNVSYLPTDLPPWTGGGNPGGRCCLPNGDCIMVPNLFGCIDRNGFFRNITDFYFGKDPTILAANPDLQQPALVEITCVGCKALPCGPIGGACFNPIDLGATLVAQPGNGTPFGTVTRFIKKKLYYKFQIPAGCGAIEIDTCGSTDAQGGGGFDTFIEVFKWSPVYPFNCVNTSLNIDVNDVGNGDADSGDLPTLPNPVPANTGTLLVVGGQVMINDDCRFDDEPEMAAAQGANGSAPCYNQVTQDGAQKDSCLCFPVVAGSPDGNKPGDWILICIGALNPDRDASEINSIDPVQNATFQPVLASLSIRCLTQCFSCDLNDIVPPGPIDLDEATAPVNPEPPCTDPGVIGTNDGCNSVLSTSTGAPVTNPPTTPITPVLNVPYYIRGSAGIFDVVGIDGQLVQHSDNDWYSFTLNDPAKVTLRLVRAEFIAQIAIRRAGNPATSNLCNTRSVVLNTATPCDDDTLDDLTIDVCAGTFYVSIRPRPPFKPVPCGAASEYLMCLTVRPQKAVSCCPGDANNDGILDGEDIQPYVDTITHPPAFGFGLRLGGCYEQSFCYADTAPSGSPDGFLTLADVNEFVNLLITKSACAALPSAQCDDADRCQLPANNRLGSTLVGSDLNPQSFTNDAAVPRDLRAADCFCPTASGAITDVCWWGAYTNRDAIFLENQAGVNCVTADNFTITYYNNAFDAELGDFCPVSLKAGPFLVTPTPVPTGNTIQLAFGDVDEYRYQVTHPPVPVTGGECCWISIVNNTTGRCTWQWETSPYGNGIAFRQENLNQGLDTFPTEWDCARDLVGSDLAFCLNIRIGSNGCDPVATVLGQCCFIDGAGQQKCLVLTGAECAINYDGLFTSGAICAADGGADLCPTPECLIACKPGDIREAEGCGFDKNGGCDDNLLAPPIIDLTPGGFLACDDLLLGTQGSEIVICGTANNLDQAGTDSDWYSFVLQDPNGEATITLGIEAQPDITVELRRLVAINTPNTDGCSELLASVSSFDGSCDIVTGDGGCLLNGVYVLRVISSFNVAVPCSESAYRVTISCSQPCCEFPDPPGDCPDFGSAEVADCLEINANDGCNGPLSPVLFEVIAPVDGPCVSSDPGPGGRVFCGTSWAEAGQRDTDWWLLPPLTLATSRVINISFRSEFPGIVFMIEVGDAPIGNVNDCVIQNLLFSATFAASINCEGPEGAMFAEFSECIPAGTWAVFVAPGRQDGGAVGSGTVPCSSRNNYQMRITCGPADCAPNCFAGTGGSQLPKPSGINVGVGGDCGAGTTDRVSSDANLITNFRAADNFLAVSGGSISKVQWWGYYENLNGPLPTISCVPQDGDVPDDFTITYYGNVTFDSDVPGVDIVSLPNNNIIGGPFSQSGVGSSLLTLTSKTEVVGQKVQIFNQPPDFINMFEFVATHESVSFNPGDCVWMEIVNNTTGGVCTWSWAVSDEGDLTAARRDADPNAPNPTTYEDNDFCRLIDLAWCVDIKTGPTGCFIFDPADNDVCTGATLGSFSMTCEFGTGLQTSVTYDLVNYSSQGPLFEPDTLDGFFGGVTGLNHLGCELNQFFDATPLKEAVAWFSFTPTGASALRRATFTLSTPTFAELLVFNPVSGAMPVTCANIAGDVANGEIADTQFRCSVGSPPVVDANNFVAGQTYLIMVAYYENLTIGRNNIFENLSQTFVITCP